MPPKKTASVKVPDADPPTTDVPKKGVKQSEKLISDTVAGEPRDVAAMRKPSTMDMMKEAFKALDSRKGISAQAIRRYILEKYPTTDAIRLKYMVRRALAKGLEGGILVRPANSTGTGAQGKFRLAVRGKAKESKGTENSDPNVEKPSVKTKAKGTAAAGSEKPKQKKKPKDEDSGSTEAPASKVAPAKKPKKAAGAKEAVPKSKVAARQKKKKAKSPASQSEGEGNAAAPAKNPGKRGKKTAQ